MKRIVCAVACMMVMVLSFIACNKDSVGYEEVSKEQLAYFEKNRAFIREKKALQGEDGKPLYQQVIISGDTALFRVLSKTGEETKYPTSETKIDLLLKGDLINGTNFQKEMSMTFAPSELIHGLRGILLQNSVGEKVEAIIPATLGYSYWDNGPVPGGSTLIFTYTLKKFN